MAADFDVRSIAMFASVPESTVNTILSDPTAELVQTFLHSLQEKAKHCEKVKAQNSKLEVELEAVVRTNESKTKVLQNSRDKALADVSKLRDDLQAAETVRAQAQSELEGLRQNVEAENSEVVVLRNKIISFEKSHRDTLSLLDSKSKEIDRLAQDLTNEHKKVVDLRRECNQLEQEKYQASSTANSAKLRADNLQQELDLQKRSIDWHEDELRKKNEEHQKFRREKTARLNELQRSLDQQSEQTDSLRRSENSLRNQLEDQNQRSEDLIKQIEKLQQQDITQTEQHRIELDAANRLAELYKDSAATAKARVEELSLALDEARDDASEEIARIRAEVQEEHNERQAAEQRVQELETRLTDLEADLHQPRTQPGTPRGGLDGPIPTTPARPGTPLASYTPRSVHRMKSGMSTTQLYTAYTQLEKDLAIERRNNEQLQAYVDSMLEDLESSKPQIEELRNENARLQSDVAEISQSAEEAVKQRNMSRQELAVLQGELSSLRTGLDHSKQMCRDLGSQVRRLLLEQQAGTLSDVEWTRLEQELQEVRSRDQEHLSDAQQQINKYLLEFKNIAQLQEQNQKLIETERKLVERLDTEELKSLREERDALKQELVEAKAKVEKYALEIETGLTQMRSFMKERDIFRNMLARRGHIEPNDFGRSLPAGGLSTSVLGDRVSHSTENDLAKLLRDVQNQYDTFRRETQTDATTLQNQLAELTKTNSELQTEVSKAKGQHSLDEQRHKMLESNYNTVKHDKQDYENRYHAASEATSRQELKLQQAAEELVETKGLIDGLRRESANLKAEKDLWKSIEQRLIDDNESLRNERSRLDQLNANLQSLLNEKEHSDAESRRRYQSQIETLESDLQTSRRRLDEEMEEKNQTMLRRNYEHEQSQKRVEESLGSVSTFREELSSVKTSRDHLQARVDELTIELRSAEERLQILVRPPVNDGSHTNEEHENPSSEREVAAENSELKRDLELKANELRKTEEHIEEYKNIAQEAEERLAQFMETNDQDKQDLEASLIEKEDKVKELQQRVEEIGSELTTAYKELSKLRDEQAESGRHLDEQKGFLQAEIDRLRASEEKAQEQASLYLEASKEQQKIAEQRQENYEHAVREHSGALDRANEYREKANTLTLDLAEVKADLENAKADLDQKETAWSDAEIRYKQQLAEAKVREAEKDQHNQSLHSTIGTYQQQLAVIKSSRSVASVADSAQELSADFSSFDEQLRSISRDKAIAEQNYARANITVNRLTGQVESLNTELENVRLKYNQEQRANLDIEKRNLEARRLKEMVGELSVYRESNAELRRERQKAELDLNEKTQKVEQLEEELIPLRARVAELENDVEYKDGEIALLQKDRDGWQQRTQNILSKYDRVDPAELEEMRHKAAQLEAERDEAVAARDTLQMRVNDFPIEIQSAKDKLKEALANQYKERSRKDKQQVTELRLSLTAATEERDSAITERDELQVALDAAQGAEKAEPAGPAKSDDGAESQVNIARSAELETLIAEKDGEIASLRAKQEKLTAEIETIKKTFNEKYNNYKKEAEAKQKALEEEFHTKLEQIRIEQQAADATDATDAADAADVVPQVDDIQEQQTQDEALIPPATDAVPLTTGEERKTFDEFADSLTKPQCKILTNKEPLKAMLRDTIEKRKKEAREELEKQLQEKDMVISEKDSIIAEKDTIIGQKDEEIASVRAIVVKEEEDKFEIEKQSILEEQQQKINDEVAKARAAQEKMSQGKLALIQKQSANNLAKVNAVKKAAEETPEKPVKEVWEMAKTAKPPTDTPKPPTTVAQPAASALATASATHASPTKLVATPQASSTSEVQSEAMLATNGVTSPSAEPKSEDVEAGSDIADSHQVNEPAGSQLPQPARSGIPQPRGSLAGRGARGNAQAGRITGIPRPGSAVGSHTANTNIRGRGGRGNHGPSSPSRGGTNLNPGAPQFTPGKRPREEGTDDGNIGKRIRGGSAGS